MSLPAESRFAFATVNPGLVLSHRRSARPLAYECGEDFQHSPVILA